MSICAKKTTTKWINKCNTFFLYLWRTRKMETFNKQSIFPDKLFVAYVREVEWKKKWKKNFRKLKFYEWNRSVSLQRISSAVVCFLATMDAFFASSLHMKFVEHMKFFFLLFHKTKSILQIVCVFCKKRKQNLKLIDCDSSSVAFVIWQLINWRVSAIVCKKKTGEEEWL